MADEQAAVVIVGDDGTEHEFPAGFDPKRAASIVRSRAPYEAPAGHGTAAMLGAPSAPYAEGVNPAESWQNQSAAALEPLAHPKSGLDLAALAVPSGGESAAASILGPIAKRVPWTRIGMGAGGAAYGAATAPEKATPLQTLGRAATYGVGGAVMPDALSRIAPKAGAALERIGTSLADWHSPLTVAGRDARAAAESMKTVVPSLAEDIGPHVLRGAEQFREPYQPPPPPNEGAPTLEELRKAGIGKGSLDLMEGRKPMPSVTPIASHETPAELHAATSPEAAERVPHPALARTNPAAAPAIEPMASHPPNVADANVSTPLGDPRVTNVNPKYPWSPEQTSQIRLGMSDWHSGALSGTPAARAGQNLHIEDHMLDQRYRQLLADPKKALLLPMLAPLLRKALMDQMQGQDTQSNQGTQ